MAYKLKKYDEANSLYSKAIELNSKCAESYVGKGYCLYHMKKWIEAVETYKKAILAKKNNQ